MAFMVTGWVREARAITLERFPHKPGIVGWFNKYFLGTRFSGTVRQGAYHLKPLALTFTADRSSLTEPSMQELRRNSIDLAYRMVFEAARRYGEDFTEFENRLSPYGRSKCLTAIDTFHSGRPYDSSAIWTIQEAAAEYTMLVQRAVLDHVQRLSLASPSSQTFTVNLSLDQKTLALSIS